MKKTEDNVAPGEGMEPTPAEIERAEFAAEVEEFGEDRLRRLVGWPLRLMVFELPVVFLLVLFLAFRDVSWLSARPAPRAAAPPAAVGPASPPPLTAGLVADATLYESDRAKSFGGKETLEVRPEQSGNQTRTLLAFRVRGVSGSPPKRATLLLPMAPGQSGLSASLKVSMCKGEWDEKTVTWNSPVEPEAMVGAQAPVDLAESPELSISLDLRQFTQDGIYSLMIEAAGEGGTVAIPAREAPGGGAQLILGR